jgi:hypothetical protein
MGRLAQYHPVTVTSNYTFLKDSMEFVSSIVWTYQAITDSFLCSMKRQKADRLVNNTVVKLRQRI